MTHRFALAFILLLALPHMALADYAAGKRAFDNKEWINAVAELRPLVEQGDARAMFLLGTMYNDGNGVLRNPHTALGLYKQAAALGNAQSMLALATMYQSGSSGYVSYKHAAKWFERCSKLGDQACAFFYGLALLRGDPTGKTDFKTDNIGAYTWLRIASQKTDYTKMQTAAIEAARMLSGRLSTQEMKKADETAAAFKPVDLSSLGPLPDDVPDEKKPKDDQKPEAKKPPQKQKK